MKKAAADAATFMRSQMGWDPAAAGSRAGDGMDRAVSEEKATGPHP